MEQQIEDTAKKRKLVTAVTLLPEVQRQVHDLASERDWSVAQAGGYLIRLGLEKLDEMKSVQESKPAQMAA